MMGMLLESVVIAFVFGGILGAVTALHLSSPKKSHAMIKERTKKE
ncbi:MAG: hypothetical protein OEZ68_10030 [Gammaproteobacteria bacterium]|nr:hypothetical protein [Gammaproteobacteria bacterium]MDH5801127.1 hypothetical protein [Gammaproteobacteria bacterium]